MYSAKDVIRYDIAMSDQVVQAYLGDLSDADLTIRPIPGMHTIAWQLGHLIDGERQLVELAKPGASPELPAGFAEVHGKDADTPANDAKFLQKDQYLALWSAQRAVTKEVLEGLTEEDMAKPTPESMHGYCPTVGAMFALVGSHPMMHVGQWVAVRRQLNKPVTI